MSLSYIPSSPIVIVCGHFGSGKTNVSVALALEMKKSGKNVTLIDIDTVNPYFRAADAKELMEKNGIKCINPEFANTNVDIPSLPSEYSLLFSGEGYSIADVGGDGDGAAVLGLSHDDYIEAGYKMYFVYNRYRYVSATPQGAADVLEAIKRASGLDFHGIINNSNLGCETDEKTVTDAIPYAEEFSKFVNLPLLVTTTPDWVDVPDTVKIKDITKKLF